MADELPPTRVIASSLVSGDELVSDLVEVVPDNLWLRTRPSDIVGERRFPDHEGAPHDRD